MHSDDTHDCDDTVRREKLQFLRSLRKNAHPPNLRYLLLNGVLAIQKFCLAAENAKQFSVQLLPDIALPDILCQA